MENGEKTKEEWIPPHPDLWKPKMWVENSRRRPGTVMIHKPLLWKFGDWEAYGKQYFNPWSSSETYSWLDIKLLQIRHLSRLGTAIDSKKRELCWMPWVLNYIKEVLANDT